MVKYFEVGDVLMKINLNSMKALFIQESKIALVLLEENFIEKNDLKKITKIKFNEALRSRMRLFKNFA